MKNKTSAKRKEITLKSQEPLKSKTQKHKTTLEYKIETNLLVTSTPFSIVRADSIAHSIKNRRNWPIELLFEGRFLPKISSTRLADRARSLYMLPISTFSGT